VGILYGPAAPTVGYLQCYETNISNAHPMPEGRGGLGIDRAF